ncbi:MAG: SOS response-associated peptidase family protein [Burkholderiales bacterium]|nr:SOS response-associated peptidase family protein [Burkholderiales bacterium]
MCTNYKSPEELDLERAWELKPSQSVLWAQDVFPNRPGPIVRLKPGGAPGERECVLANFRLIPFNVKDPEQFKASTMNARCETVDKLWSFKSAWARRQRCVIPAWAFYEPYYETASSKSVRWKVAAADGTMLSIAGLWDRWVPPAGSDRAEVISFTMITLNCDEHPLLKRFHRWYDEKGNPEEKRTPVLLTEQEVDTWLQGDDAEAKALFKTWPAEELHAEAAPIRRSAPPVSGVLL